jgi:hypothetical protein
MIRYFAINMKTIFLGLLAAATLLTLTSNATAQCEPHVFGEISNGAFVNGPRSAKITDEFLYLVYQSALETLDITDPTNIQTLDKFFFSESNDYSISGLASGTLFVEGDNGIDLFDVTDPTAITMGSTVAFPSGMTDFIVSGPMIYFGTNTGLQIYDGSDPTNPVLAGTMATWGPVDIHSVSDTGIVHMSSKFGEFEINRRVLIDASDPSSPAIVHNTPPFRINTVLEGVFAYEPYEAVFGRVYGLRVYDLTNPAAPVSAGSIEMPEIPPGQSPGYYLVKVTENLAYFRYTVWDEFDCGGGKTCYDPRLYLARIDVNDPANMTFDGPIEGYWSPMDVNGMLTVENISGAAAILDVSDLANQVVLGTHQEFIISQLWSPVFVSDQTFAATSDGVIRLDLTNPAQPRIVDQPPLTSSIGSFSTLTSGGPIGNYLFAHGTSDSLPVMAIVDTSDPSSPTIVFERILPDWDSDWNFRSVVPFGESFVAVSGGPFGTAILDVSDPTNPILISDIPGSSPVGLSSSLLIINTWQPGWTDRRFALLDVSDPFNPQIVGQSDPDSVFVGVVEGSFAYGTRYQDEPQEGVFIHCFSLENPANPVFVGSVRTSYSSDFGKLVASGQLLAATVDIGIVELFDFSDPSAPRSLGAAFSPGTVYNDPFFGPDGTLYIQVPSNDLFAIDVMSPVEVNLLGSALTTDTTFGVSTAGGLSFVSDYFGGVRIFDISDPASPFEVGAYDTPDRAYETVVIGNLAYVADGATGLVVLDVSNPASPTLVGSLALSDLAIGLAVEGDFAYLATRFDGLQILDITSPVSPVFVGSVDTPGSAQSVTLDGDLVYVADGTGGVQVIDVTARSSPQIIGSYNTPSSARQVLIRGLVAYVPDRTTGLIALDISDPTNPQLISMLAGLGDTRGIAAWGHLAFVADFNGFVHMVDIADPGDMQLVQSVPSLGTPRAISNDSRKLYLADGDAGLTILDAQPCWFNPCPADIIEDGLLDFFDIQAFLNAYSAGDGLADWNDDGQIDFFDLQRYLIDYSAGCP